MIQTILRDVDGTLLDFLASEEAAIRKLFVEFDMGECSDEMLTRYSKINRSYWERLERNEITKQQVLVGRFKEFFASEGLDAGVAEEFNAKYQYALGDTIVPRDNSLEIVRKLQGKVRQYVVSNGTIIAQNKKLRLSGLGALMDGIFLSEVVAGLPLEKEPQGFVRGEEPARAVAVGQRYGRERCHSAAYDVDAGAVS